MPQCVVLFILDSVLDLFLGMEIMAFDTQSNLLYLDNHISMEMCPEMTGVLSMQY